MEMLRMLHCTGKRPGTHGACRPHGCCSARWGTSTATGLAGAGCGALVDQRQAALAAVHGGAVAHEVLARRSGGGRGAVGGRGGRGAVPVAAALHGARQRHAHQRRAARLRAPLQSR